MSTGPKNYHHGDLKKSLMDAACVHLAEEGADSFSLRALAREVGVSQTAPYRHFKTKSCLFAAIALSGFEELTRVLRDTATKEESTIAIVIVELGLAYVDWAISNPEKYQLFFDSVLIDFSQYPELQAARDNCYHVLIETIEKGVKQGVFLARPADQLGAFLWSCIHGITSILLATVHKQKLGQQLSDSTNSATSRLENDRRALIEFAAKAISV